MRISYVKYREQRSLAPQGSSVSYEAVFRAAGIVVREEEEILFLGEIATREDNVDLLHRFGADMLPAYRNVLPIRKEDIIERQDVEIKD